MARLPIKDSVLKRLFALSGNQCAFPKCDQRVVNENGDLIADICHIEAAEEGGERFNAQQTDEQRRAFENLLILCPTHHRTTDNVSVYLVAVLQAMKREHEALFRDRPFVMSDEQLAALRDQISGIATSKLPHHGTDLLVGRDEWLQRIEDALREAHVHVVSIVAEGGVGKTALAVEWMTRLAARDWPGVERYFDWSFYSQGVREQGGASADAFVDAALRHFKDSAPRSTSPYERGERLAQLVAERRTVLILDGVEPLQHGPGPVRGRVKDPALERLLRGLAHRPFPGLCLVTTREPITDLASYHGKTVREWKLDRLSEEAGAELLYASGARHAGEAAIQRGDGELRTASREVDGHALTLRLLGRFLAKAHRGDIRKRDRVELWKADEKDGGHAGRVMRAYERWLIEDGGADGKRQLAILRLLGLFDRPASEGCIGALRRSPKIKGLTEPLFGIDEDDWNAALFELEESRLLVRDGAALDAHPLIRENFARRLRETEPRAWKAAHGRLFEHLKDSTDQLPNTAARLAPLYQAVVHGCHAGREQEACDEVYLDRIQRGHEGFSTKELGAISADLGAVACFFDKLWSVVSPALSRDAQARLLNDAGYCLRAIGRLAEAREPMRAGLEARIGQEDWKGAATSANNVSQIERTLGDLTAAVRDAKESIEFADRCGDGAQQMAGLRALADALHQASRRDEALALFQKVEEMQAELQPEIRSPRSFGFCELIFADVERAAWRGERSENQVESCRRAEELAEATGNRRALDVGLDHLTLGRARLYRALPERTAFCDAGSKIEEAVEALRHAGQQTYVLSGLLTRAWLRSAMGDQVGVRADLDEAHEIAERGPMPLHLADVHLYRARLFHDREALKEARRLIERHGYWRRREELGDAEEMAKSW